MSLVLFLRVSLPDTSKSNTGTVVYTLVDKKIFIGGLGVCFERVRSMLRQSPNLGPEVASGEFSAAAPGSSPGWC